MFNLPKVSEVKFLKLTLHAMMISVALTVLMLFSKDLLGFVLGYPIEKDFSLITTVLLIIWLFYALQNNKYQKQHTY